MKKIYLLMALFAAATVGTKAQTLLDEGFDNGTTDEYSSNIATGWTTVDSYKGNTTQYRWHNYYAEKGTSLTGTHCAACDAPTYEADPKGGLGPRKEVLLTPELNLDNTYQLSFSFEAAAAYVFEYKDYTFDVDIVDVAKGDTTMIWSCTNEDQVRNSGIPVYPWKAWTPYTVTLDLSAYQGKKIKVAFVYRMLQKTANVLYLDDVKVKQHAAETGPIAQLSSKLYNFGTLYIGQKQYSEKFSLKNVGLAGLKVTDVVLPEGVTTTIDKDKVNLAKNEAYDFQVAYKASLTSTDDGKIIIKTTGGDVEIEVLAKKTPVPDGYTYETFEETSFPPAGWTNSNWRRTDYAIEGDHSASATGWYVNQVLTSPRLDLSKGAQNLIFTYFNQFDSEEGDTYPDQDITVSLSTDGGTTWSDLWTTDYTKTGILETKTISLDGKGSDNCFVRWSYPAISTDDSSASEYSTFYLDNVLLPNLYGRDGVPGLSDLVTPKDSAVNIYNKNIELGWSVAQFADGYKLYVGTTDAANELVNGVDMKDATTYTLPSADYATMYKWKVVPYNAQGDAQNVKTWHFTTIADHSVSTFPWTEDFEGSDFVPLGWYSTKMGYSKWESNNYSPFDGKACASAYGHATGDSTMLVTPEIKLPAADKLRISFWWGNDVPVSLLKDDTTIHKNTTTKLDGIDAGFFEIFVDGKWKQLTFISDPNKDNRYWVRESFDLSPYAGKTVQFRWKYACYNFNQAGGLGLDDVKIGSNSETAAAFNVVEWNAGKVNYNDKFTSPSFAIQNLGADKFTVSKVEFSTPNFESTLKAGDEIEANNTKLFTVTFKALATNAAVTDNMKVTLNDGNTISLPVKGTALAQDTRYFGFETDAPGSVPAGFTVIDGDKGATPSFVYMNWPHMGEAFAFLVQNNNQGWNNVFNCPVGNQALVSVCPSSVAANDWIISEAIYPTASTTFSFDARNWESVNSVLPGTLPVITCMVSTTNNTDQAAFTQVGDKINLPLYDNKAWNHYSFDLSKYAGQKVYVALNYTVSGGLVAFYDNFQFDKLGSEADGISNINANADNADMTVYSVSGAVVAKGANAASRLAKGIYIINNKKVVIK